MPSGNFSSDAREATPTWGANRREPMLLLVPDPELRSLDEARLFGQSPSYWLIRAAKIAGFEHVATIPGLHESLAEAMLLSLSDRIDHTLIVVYEGTYIDPECLRWLASQPINDESYTLYDWAGKPAAWVAGFQRAVPSAMPMSEEIPWTEFGTQDIVRIVEPRDREAAERLLLRPFLGTVELQSWTMQGWLDCHLLRGIIRSGLSLAQIEASSILAGITAVGLSLLGSYWSLLVGAFVIAVCVKIAALLPVLHRLMTSGRGEVSAGFAKKPSGVGDKPYEDRVARAIRPMLHGLMICALSYLWIIESGMRELNSLRVLELIFLLISVVATVLSLAQARAILRRGGPGSRLDLPNPFPGLSKLGVTLPRSIEGAPIFELSVWVLTLSGQPILPWVAYVLVACSRLWRWLLSPLELNASETPIERSVANNGRSTITK